MSRCGGTKNLPTFHNTAHCVDCTMAKMGPQQITHQLKKRNKKHEGKYQQLEFYRPVLGQILVLSWCDRLDTRGNSVEKKMGMG